MISKKSTLIFILSTLFCISLQAQDKRFQKEREQSVIDYSNIRTILKKDGLGKFQEKRVKEVKELKVQKKILEAKRSLVPTEDEFYSFFSRYWLAKNASILRWDFAKPDYGIAKNFKALLEQIGLIKRKFSILIVNTPEISHFALPSNPKEYIFILSLPFMKSLDLSKEDISLILLEDMLRVDQKVFRNALDLKKSFVGKSFDSNKEEIQKFNKNLLKQYDRVVFKRGFSFAEQFKITKLMDTYLKPDAKKWSQYIKLLNKINKLVKTNYLFKKYLKIYPSPEMQIKWLSPKKEVL